MINPFTGYDSFRVHRRETIFGTLFVTSGYSISDIEYALRQNMHEMQAASEGSGLLNPPAFAEQAACSYFDPDGNEAELDKHTLIELVSNTRLNQALSTHPTTDAIEERIDIEDAKILRDTRRDFLASYDDERHLICLRRLSCQNGIDFLIMPDGKTAQKQAIGWLPTN